MLSRTAILWIVYAAIIGFVAGASLFSPQIPPTQTQTVKTGNGSPGETGNEISAPKSSDDRIANYTGWLAAFTCALVVISAVQIHFLIRSDETTRITAESGKRAADAAIALERPRLLLRNIKIGNYTTRNAAGGPEHSMYCYFVIENYGKTPAILQWSSINLRRIQGLPDDPPYRNLRPWQDRTIYNGKTTDVLQEHLPSIDLPLGDPLQGFEIFLFGYLTFDDVFGSRRTTGFCYGMNEGKFIRLRHPAYEYDREVS